MDFTQARNNFFEHFYVTVEAFADVFESFFDALDAFAEGATK